MKKGILLSVVTLIVGVLGAVLRWMEQTMGFEAETGLAIPGNVPAIALIILACLFAVFLIVTAIKTKHPSMVRYGQVSPAENPLCFGAYSVASLLMAVAGVLFIAKALMEETISISRLILGLFAIGTAVSLIFTAKMDDQGENKRQYRFRLLIPPFFCCYWLILAYEGRAANPVVLQYVYELFAIICVLLAFYYIASFDFGKGKLRQSLFFGYMASFFSITTLADKHALESVLLYLSVSLYLLFYLAKLIDQKGQEKMLTT